MWNLKWPEGPQVAVGSTNRAKVEAVRAVFSRVWPNLAVRPVPVTMPPEIGEMPVGENVKAGAIHRAKAALASGADFGVGLEGGVDFEGETCYLFNWVAIAGKGGFLSAAPSGRLRLPASYARAIRAGKVLGDLMVEKVGRADVNAQEGAVGYLTKGLVSRQRFFEECLALALAPYLSADEYQDEAEM